MTSTGWNVTPSQLSLESFYLRLQSNTSARKQKGSKRAEGNAVKKVRRQKWKTNGGDKRQKKIVAEKKEKKGNCKRAKV